MGGWFSACFHYICYRGGMEWVVGSVRLFSLCMLQRLDGVGGWFCALVFTMYVTEAGWSGLLVQCLFSLYMLQRRDGVGGWFCVLVFTMYVTEAGWSGLLILSLLVLCCACFHYVCYRGGMEWAVGSACLFSLCMLQRRDGVGGWFCVLVFTMYVTEAGWSGRLVLCACFHYVCYRGGMEWAVGSVCLFSLYMLQRRDGVGGWFCVLVFTMYVTEAGWSGRLACFLCACFHYICYRGGMEWAVGSACLFSLCMLQRRDGVGGWFCALVFTIYVTEAGWSGRLVLCACFHYVCYRGGMEWAVGSVRLFSLYMLQRRDGVGGWFCALVFTMYVTEAGWSGRLVLCACFHYVCDRGGMEWAVGSVLVFTMYVTEAGWSGRLVLCACFHYVCYRGGMEWAVGSVLVFTMYVTEAGWSGRLVLCLFSLCM